MLMRRALLRTVAVGLLAAPMAGEAQQTGKIYRIGYLTPARPDRIAHLVDAFDTGLRDLGYVEGQNIIIERRFADGKIERLPELATELVGLDLDLIHAGTNAAIAAAKQATTTIPIVMSIALDPVKMGFIESLARPGRNLTGTTFEVTPETIGKNVEFLKEAAPALSHLVVLWNPAFPGRRPHAEAAEQAAQKLGMTAEAKEVLTPADIDSALVSLKGDRSAGLFVISDPMIYNNRLREIAAWAVENQRPATCDLREFVQVGGLMSYGANMAELARRGASYVDKILKGAKPADLPVEQPTKFELVVNLKTAQALGLTIPPLVLMRAEELIE